MGKNNKNENVHVERQDNTQVRRPVLQERFQKASPTRQIQSYIEAYGYPVQPTISAQEKSSEERAIARDSYVAKQAEERLKKKGQLIRENIGFVPLVGDAVDTGITTLEVATGREKPYMMGLSLLGFLPFGDWFKKGLSKVDNNQARAKLISREMNNFTNRGQGKSRFDFVDDLILNHQHGLYLNYPEYYKNVIQGQFKSSLDDMDKFASMTADYAPTSNGIKYYAFSKIPKNVPALERARQFYKDDVLWRMQRQYPNDYYITRPLRTQLEQFDPYEDIELYNFKYNDNNIGGTAYGKDLITINPENKFGQEALDETLVHEGEHIQRAFIKDLLKNNKEWKPMFTQGSDQVLNTNMRAAKSFTGHPYFKQEARNLDMGLRFNKDFLDTHLEADELAEKGATARELRYKISKQNNVSREHLNNTIQNMSPEDLLNNMVNQNGYANSFIKQLGEANGLYIDDFKSFDEYLKALSKTPYFDQRIQNIKDALLGSFKQGGIIGINNIGI